MYCEKCGSQIENGAQFCVHCGSPVSPAGGTMSASSAPANTAALPHASIKIFSILGIVGATLLVCSALLYTFWPLAIVSAILMGIAFGGYGYHLKLGTSLKYVAWVSVALSVIALFSARFPYTRRAYAWLGIATIAFCVAYMVDKKPDDIIRRSQTDKIIAGASAVIWVIAAVLCVNLNANFRALQAFVILGSVTFLIVMAQLYKHQRSIFSAGTQAVGAQNEIRLFGIVKESVTLLVLSAVSALSFFLPFVTFTAGSVSYSTSALNLAMGNSAAMTLAQSLAGQDASTYLLALVFLPIISIVCVFAIRKKPVMRAVCGLLAIVNVFTAIVGVSSAGQVGMGMISSAPGIGFVLILITDILTVLAWIYASVAGKSRS